MIHVDEIPYGGWKKCLRIANKEIEAIVTQEVGPRIIRFGFIGGENEFIEYPEQVEKASDGAYHSFGGHRLWIAPEDRVRTYHPDNQQVDWMTKGESLHIIAPVETTTRVQKSLELWIDARINTVHVIHRIKNCSEKPMTLSAWALSVMAPVGYAIIPQEPFHPHPESLLPVRPLVLWSYTDITDNRYRWGKRFIQVHQDRTSRQPQKIGMLNTQGWAGYVRGDHLFVKTVPYHTNETYPDFNCNLEVFTNTRMLEVETLSPLKTLEPGKSVQHEEHWFLFRGLVPGSTEEELEQAIHRLLPLK